MTVIARELISAFRVFQADRAETNPAVAFAPFGSGETLSRHEAKDEVWGPKITSASKSDSPPGVNADQVIGAPAHLGRNSDLRD